VGDQGKLLACVWALTGGQIGNRKPPSKKLALRRAMDEMRQEAVVRLTSVGRLKPTLLGHSASHSERLFLPPKQPLARARTRWARS